MSKKINISKVFLYQEYITKKKPAVLIAKEINCSTHAVYNHLTKNGISIRTNSEAKNSMVARILSKDFLIKEYIVNKKSTTQIAKEVGCSVTVVCNYLRKYNIKIRTNGETHTKWDKILTKEFLIKEYIINKKSMAIIASEIGSSQNGVRYNLIKHEIEMRNSGEGNKGENNWHWKDGCSSKKYYCTICNRTICIQTALYGGSGLCNICSNTGKNNPNYIHGKGNLPYPIEFNNSLKESIRERDNHTCQKCFITEKEYKKIFPRVLDVHHIDYDKQNCKEENLITLCGKCNSEVNFNRDYWESYFKNKILKENKICLPI